MDYSWQPSESKDSKQAFQYILVVQDIFSRRIMARPLQGKTSETCQKAFESIVDESKTKPNQVSTDLGFEFKGAFDQYLEREGIYHRLKDPRALNSQGTLDAAIKVLRSTLARIQGEDRTKNWAAEVQRAVNAYNHVEHAHLHGRAPDEVQDDGNLRFYLQKQAAQDFAHNSELVKARDAKIAAAGHFRVELAARKFNRSHQVKYGDKVHTVQTAFADRVVDTEGDEFIGRHVLPVPVGSTDFASTRTIVAPADEKKKAALEPFKAQVANFLGNQGKFEFEVANYMKEIGMARLMVHGLSYRRAMQLMGFTVHGNARGSGKQLVTKAGRNVPGTRPLLMPVQAAAALAAPRRRMGVKQPG
jgi:hypothetical protein